MRALYFLAIVIIVQMSSCAIFDNFNPQPCDPPAGCSIDTSVVDTITDPLKPFMKGQLVLTYPSKIQLDSFVSSSGITYKINTAVIKNIVKVAVDEMINDGYKGIQPLDTSEISVKRCLCNENLFIIESDAIIGHENNVAEASTKPPGVGGEGGVFSLNYLINSTIDEENVPLFVTNTDSSVVSEVVSGKNAPITAILDSGVDATYFDDKRGFFQKRNFDPDVCELTNDKNGYNFTGKEPDNNIQDSCGHGTVVSLAYKRGLDELNQLNQDLWENQRLLTVKVLDRCGYGTTYSTICGLAYARRRNAQVINCSWGLYFNEFQLQRAIGEISQDVSIVCSAGNKGRLLETNSPSGEGYHFPSGYGFSYMVIDSVQKLGLMKSGRDNVFEVAALKRNFCESSGTSSPIPFAEYSNYRDNTFAEIGNNAQFLVAEVDCRLEGTSFAAPIHSAGIIARGTSVDAATGDYSFTLPTNTNMMDSSYNHSVMRTGYLYRYFTYFNRHQD